MQGKAADVVVLVLGADRSPSRKARDWVGDPPNLLNVAVSRARRRLFVIGGYDEWASAPNFGVFAARKAFTRQPYGQSAATPDGGI
jgi:superfamily I DNA and/or RNA helicase